MDNSISDPDSPVSTYHFRVQFALLGRPTYVIGLLFHCCSLLFATSNLSDRGSSLPRQKSIGDWCYAWHEHSLRRFAHICPKFYRGRKCEIWPKLSTIRGTLVSKTKQRIGIWIVEHVLGAPIIAMSSSNLMQLRSP